MNYLLLAFLGLSILHFYYESIAAPLSRLRIQDDLFALRDELRRLKIDVREGMNDQTFHMLQDSINSLISSLEYFDLMTIASAMVEIKRDQDLRKRMEARLKIIQDSTMPEVKAIRARTVKLADQLVFINSGAWGFYLLPLAMMAAGFAAIKKKVMSIISLSTLDFQRVAPMKC